MSFAKLTRTGIVGVAEVRMLLKAINPAVSPSNKEIEQLIEDASPGMPASCQGTQRAGEGDHNRLGRIQEEELGVRFASQDGKANMKHAEGVRFAGPGCPSQNLPSPNPNQA